MSTPPLMIRSFTVLVVLGILFVGCSRKEKEDVSKQEATGKNTGVAQIPNTSFDTTRPSNAAGQPTNSISANMVGADQIHYAVKSGDVSKLKQLIAANPTIINAQDKDGNTPLHLAAEAANTELVDYLIMKGAKIDILNTDNQTPLHLAIIGGGLTITLSSPFSGTVTGAVSKSKQEPEEVALLLLTKGADANAEDKYGATPLRWACSRGYVRVANELLKRGANADHGDLGGVTPLQKAAMNGSKAIISLLVGAGANASLADKQGITPLIQAIACSNSEAADCLLKSGSALESQDKKGHTALQWAAVLGHGDCAKLLVEKGAKLETPDALGRTALHWASYMGQAEIVKMLLKANANCNAVDKDGKTPSDLAVQTAKQNYRDCEDEFKECFPIDSYSNRTQNEEGHKATIELFKALGK